MSFIKLFIYNTMATKYSLCICAYNEENNIDGLLASIEKQKPTHYSIEEIIVVSSSTDNTNSIVKKHEKKDKRVKLIVEKEKKGKVAAINTFLSKAKYKNCILTSGDVLFAEKTAHYLTKELENPDVGICGSHPTPLNKKKGLIGHVVHILWEMHHYVASKHPKFGESIAFKNVFGSMPNNAVDEEYIAHLVMKTGLKGKYIPEAIVYNYGPENIKDFLIQRRRIHCGHLALKNKNNYVPATTNNGSIIKELPKLFKKNSLFFIGATILLEAYGRFLGRMDFMKKKAHTNWQVATSTKKDLNKKM